MMTMLHSVWSGGGSAAGRRRSLLALGALLALIASVLVWATPTQAQGTNQPPTVIIAPATLDTNDPPNIVLNGSFSFDPDDDTDATTACTGCTYKWEVLTASYKWIEGTIADATAASTTVPRPAESLVPAYGSTIEFQLTVTDNDQAEASATVTYSFDPANEGPTASISLSATLEDTEAGDDVTGTDRYTVDAVIDGPGENGNAENEWDIMEGALLVLDATGSTDPEDDTLTETWALAYQSSASGVTQMAGLATIAADLEMLSTDDSGTDAVETLGPLNVGTENGQSPYYLIYTLTVDDGNDNTSATSIRILVHDQPADPKVSIGVQGDNAQTANLAEGFSGGPTGGQVQVVAPPDTSKKYLVPPVGEGETAMTITFAATATDADASGTDGAPTLKWEASGGVATGADLTTGTLAFTVPDDAEVGDTFTISVTATDAARKSVTATDTVTVEIVENTLPVISILTDGTQGTPAYVITGAPGEDGKFSVTGFAFDEDGDSLTLVWTQRNATFQGGVDADDDEYIALEGAFSNTVSFARPEKMFRDATDSNDIVNFVFTAIDSKGAFSTALVTVNIPAVPDTTVARAEAGSDQVVAPGSRVVLSGSAPGVASVSSYAWALTGVSTNPSTRSLTEAQSDKVHEDLASLYGADGDNDGNPDAYADILTAIATTPAEQYQHFMAPKVSPGLKYVQLTFTLTVNDGTNDLTDTVTVTVADNFFSSYIDGPDYCLNRSAGGPRTYAHDSNGDGVADVCALDTTRQAAVARQNALQQLADLGLEVTSEGSPATYLELIIGRAAVEDDSATTEDETESATTGLCATTQAHPQDSEDDLASDVCSTKKLSPGPAPIDPADADTYYSGIITGPDFCTNFSLGGARQYAHDGDGDGVADVCALPYSGREAEVRQKALEEFVNHPQFATALAAACTALGNTDFGDDPADLAKYPCTGATDPGTGDDLPTVGS